MSRPLVAPLVGVIDLLHGAAVHAIAGRRQHYRPVPFCLGNFAQLAAHYQKLGLTSLYVADLDAIGGKPIQWTCLVRLLEMAFDRILIDIGWKGSESSEERRQLAAIAERFPASRWIVATESCLTMDSFAVLGKWVTPAKVFLGLDFRGGEFLGAGGSLEQWLAMAQRAQSTGVVVLDVAAVGTGAGPATLEICRTVGGFAPELEIYSGGGVRDAGDVQRLMRGGCRGVLAATALYPGGLLCEFPNSQWDSGLDLPFESFD